MTAKGGGFKERTLLGGVASSRITGSGGEDTAMHVSNESLLVILFVGLVAGWLAGKLFRGAGFGIIGDIIIGVVGAFIGDWLLPRLSIHLGTGIISAIVNATIGALLLLLIIRLVRGGSRWRSGWGGGWRQPF